jgi:hypothetical protein
MTPIFELSRLTKYRIINRRHKFRKLFELVMNPKPNHLIVIKKHSYLTFRFILIIKDVSF